MSAFKQAVEALWPNSEPALTLTYTHERAGICAAVDLRRVNSPRDELGQFWTLSVPKWMREGFERGELHPPLVNNTHPHTWRRKRQHPSGAAAPKSDPNLVDAFPDDYHNPFLVVEIDYLLFGARDKPGDTLKQLQREAVSFALQASGFPYTVLIDTGGKSIHAVLRLTDSPDQVRHFRHLGIAHLIECLGMVLGEVDSSVLKTSGTHRLARMPEAQRDNGRIQSILAVNRPVALTELFDWCHRQIRPEILEEMRTRPAKVKVSQREYRLRDSAGDANYGAIWRRELLQPHVEHRGEAVFKINNEIARCGLNAPTMISPPSNGGVGVWEAPFLWWVSAYVFHQQSRGWFFSSDPKDWGHSGHNYEEGAFERCRWPDFAELQGKMQEDSQYAAPSSLRTSDGALLLYKVLMREYEAAQEQQRDQRFGDPDTDPDPQQRQAQREQRVAKMSAPLAIQFFLENYPRYLVYLPEDLGGEYIEFTGKVWEPVRELALQDWISEHIQWWLPAKEINSVMSYLKVHHQFKPRHWVQKDSVVVFENGTFMLDETDNQWKFYENWWSPDHYMRTMVPHNWTYSDHCPQFKAWLDEYLPDKSLQAILQEWTGYLFTSGQPYQKFLMMLGHGGNGKGVYMQTVSMLLGEHNCGAFHLAGLGGRFALATYSDKMLIYDGDADEKPKASEDGASAISVLKKWTGGDPVAMERKNQQPFTRPLNAKCMMSANIKPRWVDPSKGIWRRMIPMPWDVTVDATKIEENFHRRFIPEINGIIGWAVQGLARLTSQRGFTRSARIDAFIAEYRSESDAVLSFIDEYLERDEQDQTGMVTDLRPIYDCYKAHCESLMSHPCSLTQFKSRLQGYDVPIIRPRGVDMVRNMPLEHGGKRPWCLGPQWKCVHPQFQSEVGSAKVIAFPQTPY